MKKIATITVYQNVPTNKAPISYEVVLAVNVETPFGIQEFRTVNVISYGNEGKSAEGKYILFARAVKSGVDECLKRLRSNILSKPEKPTEKEKKESPSGENNS